jgi:hypothetical protein
MTETEATTWRELCPYGRTIYYEGDNPEGFRRKIKAEFGFDPAKHPGVPIDQPVPESGHGSQPTWGRFVAWDEDEAARFGEPGFLSYSFHCPPEHLDAIYGSDRFPLGS